MIERLILSRFRGIRKGVIKDIGKINLLIGPNNSGKTAMLEALYWLSVSGRGCGIYSRGLPEVKDEDGLSRRSRDAFVPIEADLLGFPPCPRIWKRHGKSELWQHPPGFVSEGTLVCKIPHLKGDDPFKTFKLISPPADEIRDTERFDEDTLSTTGVFVLDNPEGMDDILKYYLPDLYPDDFSSDENVHRRFAFTWYPNFIHWERSLGAWGVEGTVADADCVFFFDFHATDCHFTKEFWWAMRDVRGWRKQLTGVLGELNILETTRFSVNIEPHPTLKDAMQGTIETEEHGTLPIDDFGDGARHAFKVLAGLMVLADRCKDGREGLFLWEDPELFMHSKSLFRLIREVLEIVKDKSIQVFISTQSLEVIAFFVKSLKEKELSGLQNVSRAFRMELVDGKLITARSTHSKLDAWLESGWDPRFWNQTDVILHHQVELNGWGQNE